MEPVLGVNHTVQATFTRPADTNVYAAGDVICNSTSAPQVLTFLGPTREASGRGAILQEAILISSANQSTKLEAELWLFDTTVVAVNDNAAFAPSDAETLTLLAVVPFYAADWRVGNASAGAAGNAVCQAINLGRPINVTGASNNSIFGVLVARNAYTPVSAEVFTIKLKFLD